MNTKKYVTKTSVPKTKKRKVCWAPDTELKENRRNKENNPMIRIFFFSPEPFQPDALMCVFLRIARLKKGEMFIV